MKGLERAFGSLGPREGIPGFFIPALVLLALAFPPLVFYLIGAVLFTIRPAGRPGLAGAAVQAPRCTERRVGPTRAPPPA